MQKNARTLRSFEKNAKERKNVAFFGKERLPNPDYRTFYNHHMCSIPPSTQITEFHHPQKITVHFNYSTANIILNLISINFSVEFFTIRKV